MMVENVKMDNVPKQNSSNEVAQIDKEIKTLQEQLKRIRKDDKMPPDDKAKKIKELEQRIALLQERKAQAKQKAQAQNEKAGSQSSVNNVEAQKLHDDQGDEDGLKSSQDARSKYDRLKLSSHYQNLMQAAKE